MPFDIRQLSDERRLNDFNDLILYSMKVWISIPCFVDNVEFVQTRTGFCIFFIFAIASFIALIKFKIAEVDISFPYLIVSQQLYLLKKYRTIYNLDGRS